MEDYVTKAHEFLPERWLKNNASECQYKFHPYSSLPYGHGARMCLGRRFADLEIQVLLAKVSKVMLGYNFELGPHTIQIFAHICYAIFSLIPDDPFFQIRISTRAT